MHSCTQSTGNSGCQPQHNYHNYMASQIVVFSDCSLCRTTWWGAVSSLLACRERSTSHRSSSLCTGYWFSNGWLTSWQLWCTNALMVVLRSTWQSSVIRASTDVQEWDQRTVEIKLHVPCVQTSFGDRSFAIAGSRTWNNLPDAIRDSSLSFLTFAKLLKSYLFVWLPRRLWYLTGT